MKYDLRTLAPAVMRDRTYKQWYQELALIRAIPESEVATVAADDVAENRAGAWPAAPMLEVLP